MQEKSHKQQVELLLGEIDVHGGERNGVKGQIPGGEPGIFPLVRHRYDMVADHVEPLAVPHLAGWLHRVDAMFLEPFVNIEEEILFAPQHPGQRLPHHIRRIFADTGRRYRAIERIRLAPARLDDLREPPAERFLTTGCRIAQPQPDDGRRPRADA
jgi:hypothetical protein